MVLCQRNIKHPPKLLGEEFEDLPQPKVCSQRFSVKAMFLGMVGQPLSEREFDGWIFLERVNAKKMVRKLTAHQNFTNDRVLNSQLKGGAWRNLHSEGMTIKFIYKTKVGKKGNKKVVRIFEEDERFEGLV